MTRTQVKTPHPSQKETNKNWENFGKKLIEYGFLQRYPNDETSEKFSCIFIKEFNDSKISAKIEVKCYSYYDPYFEYSYEIQNLIFEELACESDDKSIINNFSFDLLKKDFEDSIIGVRDRYSEQERNNYLLLKSFGYRSRYIGKNQYSKEHFYNKEINGMHLSFELGSDDSDDEDYKSCKFKVYYYDSTYDKHFDYEERFKFSEFNVEFVKKIEAFVLKVSETLGFINSATAKE